MNKTTQLLELVLDRRDGHVCATLLSWATYPPSFQISEGKVEQEATPHVLEGENIPLPPGRALPAALRPDLDDWLDTGPLGERSRGGPEDNAQPSRALRWSSPSDSAALRDALPPSRLIDRFWKDASARAAAGGSARLTLVGDWAPRLISSGALPFAVVRRRLSSLGLPVDLSLPLVASLVLEGEAKNRVLSKVRAHNVLAGGGPPGAAQTTPPKTTGDYLFGDDLILEARQLGGFDWREGPEPLAPIRHIIGDPIDLRGTVPPLLRKRGHLAPAPRIVVLHDEEGSLSRHQAVRAVEHAVAEGASAALAVSAPLESGFFRMFYRAILHNQPLDLALMHSLSALPEGERGYAFSAQPSGELAVLLGLAVAESAARELRVGTSNEPKHLPSPRSIGDGGRPEARWIRRFPPTTPRRPIVDEAKHRAERLTSDLVHQVDELVRQQGGALDKTLRDSSNAVFLHEGHALSAMLHMRDAARDLAKVVATGTELLERMEKAGPERVREARARSTKVWLSEGGRELNKDIRLVLDRSYGLHVQITPEVKQAWAEQLFPEEATKKLFEKYDWIALDLRLFFEPDRVECDRRADRIQLPRVGSSDEVTFTLAPKVEGRSRVRVCLYRANFLLQSLTLDFTAVPADERAADAERTPGHAVTLDWSASPDLALLDDLPAPILSIWTNETESGAHWLGVSSSSASAGSPALRSGELFTFAPAVLGQLAGALRTKLLGTEGFDAGGNGYYFYDETPPIDEEEQCRRLVKLAQEGFRVYNQLFVLNEGCTASTDRPLALQSVLDTPGILSIARCSSTTTIPWAALYYLPIEVNTDHLRLCSVFRDQLRQNEWSEDGKTLKKDGQKDLLDRPEECRAQCACPLKTKPDDMTVVCPFGFLGLRHQIEQPLLQVHPGDGSAPPPELAAMVVALDRPKSIPIQIRMGYYPDFPRIADHRAHVAALRGASGRTISCAQSDIADDIRTWLRAGADPGDMGEPHDIYYFYCHGETDTNKDFRLRFGPLDGEAYVGPSDIFNAYVAKSSWAHFPLVMLNACDSLSTTPEVGNPLLIALQRRAASAVVGTEIKIDPGFGQRCGEDLLQRLLDGRTLGEAFLDLRRDLLRRHNPLGLAYTFYGSAALHFHDPDACTAPGCPVRRALL